MSIPESQLETWTAQPSPAASASTYDQIRAVLESSGSPIRDKDYDVSLQGSYKNHTNIRADSDVDIIVKLTTTFRPDTHLLDAPSRATLDRLFPDATYRWADFRRDVLTALRVGFASSPIKEATNGLKLPATASRLPADIVVSIEHRYYLRLEEFDGSDYLEGIAFWTYPDLRLVVNFPDFHYHFGVQKNDEQHTDGMYKPIVRMFKNARNYLIDAGSLPATTAPSYFLECLLFNVPDDLFEDPLQRSYLDIVLYLFDADLDGMKCQNKIDPLFGDTPQQWSQTNAKSTITSLASLWTSFT